MAIAKQRVHLKPKSKRYKPSTRAKGFDQMRPKSRGKPKQIVKSKTDKGYTHWIQDEAGRFEGRERVPLSKSDNTRVRNSPDKRIYGRYSIKKKKKK
ncbi:hypothetical protein KY320_01425 [Candidatus Woesearchaeota archaeon]|nr:hypothetical protein [Candidatus Woesearchaeota archaeon]